MPNSKLGINVYSIRKVLCEVAQLIFVYGALIWGTVLSLIIFRNIARDSAKKIPLGSKIGISNYLNQGITGYFRCYFNY